MSQYTTVGVPYGDIFVGKVYCDNVRVCSNGKDGDYKFVLVFSAGSGVNGMLVNVIRELCNKEPSYVVSTCTDHTIGYVEVSRNYPVRVSRHQTLQFDGQVTQLSTGKHKLSKIADYSPL